MLSHSKVRNACSYCKRQKRRCDKQTPRCTTCQRAGRVCDYSENKRDDVQDLRSKVVLLERALMGQSGQNGQEAIVSRFTSKQAAFQDPSTVSHTQNASFSAAWFLDVDCFEKMGATIPRPIMPASDDILRELGSPDMRRNIASSHFNTTHTWLAIIWRRKIETLVASQEARLLSGTAILLASMKLLAQAPDEKLDPTENRLYVLLKDELTVLENQGFMSVGLVQAAILLAAYEMGHAIYPTAYFSVARCVNVAHMIGLHDQKSAPQGIGKLNFWSETEELTRIWCAILVLDRYINLGSRYRPLVSGSFAEDQILPCNTLSWDRGEPSPSIPLFLTSAPSVSTDAFARVCQVAHLTDHIFRHRDDKTLTGLHRFTSAKHLLKTMDSLIGLLVLESESHSAYLAPYAMALGCKMIFFDVYVCTETNGRINCAEELELQAVALGTYRDVMREAERLAVKMLENDTDHVAAWAHGPFVGHCLYQGALTAVWYLSESGSKDTADGLRTFLTALERMNRRWKVAGEYRRLIEITDMHSRQALTSEMASV